MLEFLVNLITKTKLTYDDGSTSVHLIDAHYSACISGEYVYF